MKHYKRNNSTETLIFICISQQCGPTSNRINSILGCVRMNISKKSRQVILHLHSRMGRPHLGCCTSSSLSSTDINSSVNKITSQVLAFKWRLQFVSLWQKPTKVWFFHRGFNLDHQKPERQNQKPQCRSVWILNYASTEF